MSIIKYKAKKSKSGYLYKVRIYRVIDGKCQDFFKSGFKSLREARQYEAMIYHKKASGDLSGLLRVSERRFDGMVQNLSKHSREDDKRPYR